MVINHYLYFFALEKILSLKENDKDWIKISLAHQTDMD